MQGFSAIVCRVFAESNQAGQGCDKGSRTADVNAHQKVAVVLAEAGKKNGRGNVTDDLAGKNADQQGVFLKKEGEQLLHCGKTGHISCENEEAYEGEEKSVVYFSEGFSVKKQDGHENDRRSDEIGNDAEHDSNGEGKQNQIDNSSSLGKMQCVRFMKLDGNALDRHTTDQNHYGCREEKGEHYGHEFHIADVVFRVDVKVLGIAEGGQHTTKIGGDVLHDEDKRHVGLFSRGRQNVVAKGKKGNECHVVCNQHGTEEGDEHQRSDSGTEISRGVDDASRENGEKADVLQRAHHGQRTEQTRKRLEVKISDIVAVGFDQKAGDDRKTKGDHKDGIFF